MSYRFADSLRAGSGGNYSNGICHTGLLTACEQDQDGMRVGSEWNWFRPNPASKLSANLYDIYHCCAYSEKTPDDGQRNCPKHVEFHSKINLRNKCI
jgi:hypothetical protein